MRDQLSKTTLRTEIMLKTAMGSVFCAALEDPAVIEIMVNPDGCVWLDRHGDGRIKTDTVLSDGEAERVVRVVGSHIGREVTREHPVVSAELPGGGERFEGVIPPVAVRPCFGGISTIHGNCGISGLQRLEQLCGEASSNIPRTLIAQAIDLIVFISGRGENRKVSSIREVVAPDDEAGEYFAPEYPDPNLKLVSLTDPTSTIGETS